MFLFHGRPSVRFRHFYSYMQSSHVSGVPYMHRASATQSRPPFSHPSFFSLISSPPLVATILIFSTHGNESAASYLFDLCTPCNILFKSLTFSELEEFTFLQAEKTRVCGVTLLCMHLWVIIEADYTLAIVNNATVITDTQASLCNDDF